MFNDDDNRKRGRPVKTLLLNKFYLMKIETDRIL